MEYLRSSTGLLKEGLIVCIEFSTTFGAEIAGLKGRRKGGRGQSRVMPVRYSCALARRPTQRCCATRKPERAPEQAGKPEGGGKHEGGKILYKYCSRLHPHPFTAARFLPHLGRWHALPPSIHRRPFPSTQSFASAS